MVIRTQRMRSWAPHASSLAVMCALGVVSSAIAQTADRSFHFDITNQSLSQALRNFAHVCGQEVVFTEDMVAGQATSLEGEYTAQAALNRLLQGTDLVAERSSSGAIMITSQAARKRAPTCEAQCHLAEQAPAPHSKSTRQLLRLSLRVHPLILPRLRRGLPPRHPRRRPPVPWRRSSLPGTKRAENIQSVPSSVFVATAVSMERANIRDFDDLVKIAPSLTITKTSQPANNSINIRGIGTYAYSIATESSVAVVVDDIPQAFQAEAFSSFVDVRQVEVLRGPQNTLFGKSASAGVVNITTESPTDTFTGRGEVMHTFDDESR